MNIAICVLILMYFVFLYASIRVMYKNELEKYTKFKMMTSATFLAIGFISFLISDNLIYFRFLPGFIFCFIGDLFLAIAKSPNGLLKKKKFLFGLISFGLAHILFIEAIIKMLSHEVGFLFLVFTCLGFLFVFQAYKRDKYELKGKLFIPCLTYTIFVSSFVGMTVTYIVKEGISASTCMLLMGSICFMISDMILSFKYFGREKKQWYIKVELILYYFAMLLLSTFIIF